MQTTSPQEKFEALVEYAREQHRTLADFDKISLALDAHCEDKELNKEVLAYFKKEYYAHKRKDGMTKIGIGSIIILAGFLITCINFHSNDSFNFAMYGLTSIGICVVFWGFYNIIG